MWCNILYQSVYVFVQHSVDEISLGQTITLFLKFETMHSFPEAMVSRYLGWKETMQRMGVNRDAFKQFIVRPLAQIVKTREVAWTEPRFDAPSDECL